MYGGRTKYYKIDCEVTDRDVTGGYDDLKYGCNIELAFYKKDMYIS